MKYYHKCKFSKFGNYSIQINKKTSYIIKLLVDNKSISFFITQ